MLQIAVLEIEIMSDSQLKMVLMQCCSRVVCIRHVKGMWHAAGPANSSRFDANRGEKNVPIRKGAGARCVINPFRIHLDPDIDFCDLWDSCKLSWKRPRCCPSDSELALTCALATSWELMEVFFFRLRSTIWNLATRAAGHRLQGTKVDSHGQSTL